VRLRKPSASDLPCRRGRRLHWRATKVGEHPPVQQQLLRAAPQQPTPWPATETRRGRPCVGDTSTVAAERRGHLKLGHDVRVLVGPDDARWSRRPTTDRRLYSDWPCWSAPPRRLSSRGSHELPSRGLSVRNWRAMPLSFGAFASRRDGTADAAGSERETAACAPAVHGSLQWSAAVPNPTEQQAAAPMRSRNRCHWARRRAAASPPVRVGRRQAWPLAGRSGLSGHRGRSREAPGPAGRRGGRAGPAEGGKRRRISLFSPFSSFLPPPFSSGFNAGID